MNNKIAQLLVNILLLTSTTLALYFLIFRRIFIKEIIFVLTTENIEQNRIFFFSLFLCSLTVLVLLVVSFFFLNKNPDKKLTIFSKLLLKLNYYSEKYNIFYKAYGIIFDFIGHKKIHHFVSYTNNILNYSYNKNVVLIVLAVVLPRIVIILTFVFEIYTKQLHYYFFSLSLLLIPVIFRFLIFIFNDLPKKMLPIFNAEYIERKLLEELIEIPAGTSITTTESKKFRAIGFKFKAKYADADFDFFMFTYYYPMLYITGHMELVFLPLYIKIKQITIFTYTVIQVLGWGYILFYIF